MSSPPSHPPTSKPKAKHIANPRRLLILSPPSQSIAIIPPLLHSLTGVPVRDPPQQTTNTDSPSTSQKSPDAEPNSAPATTSFAGYTTHSPLHLNTKYYTAEVPVWVDEVPIATEGAASAPSTTTQTETPPKPGQWRTEFLSDEAEIVRDAVGALLVCVRNPADADGSSKIADPASRADVRAIQELMRDIGAVKGCIDEERGGVGDVPGIFVLVGKSRAAARGQAQSQDSATLDLDEGLGDELSEAPFSVGWWEDQLFDMGLVGWEVVEWDPQDTSAEKTRNQFGGKFCPWLLGLLFLSDANGVEYEGMPRIKEVLETHDWTACTDSQDLDADLDLSFDDDLESELLGLNRSADTPGFGQEVNELEREMLGLRMAIERGGDGGDDETGQDDDVESMDAIMMRVQAIRGMYLPKV